MIKSIYLSVVTSIFFLSFAAEAQNSKFDVNGVSPYLPPMVLPKVTEAKKLISGEEKAIQTLLSADIDVCDREKLKFQSESNRFVLENELVFHEIAHALKKAFNFERSLIDDLIVENQLPPFFNYFQGGQLLDGNNEKLANQSYLKLNDYFSSVRHPQQSHQLFLAKGENPFYVMTSVDLSTPVDKVVSSKLKDQISPSLIIQHLFSDLSSQWSEQRFWVWMRENEVSINGIPIDAQLRKKYFESKLSLKCQSPSQKNAVAPGPYEEDHFASNYLKNSCVCPAGFVKTPNSQGCVKVEATDLIAPVNPIEIRQGESDLHYGSRVALMAQTTSVKTPFSFEYGHYDTTMPRLLDGKAQKITDELFDSHKTEFWTKRVRGPSRVGIQGNGGWLTKSFCIDIKESKNYVIHVGADDQWKIKINGKDFASCGGEVGGPSNPSDGACMNHSVFLEQHLPAGKTVVELKLFDFWHFGGLWFELFDNNFEQIKKASQDSDLSVVFSTKDLLGGYWDEGGEVCPDGYEYDICSSEKKCKKTTRQECMK